MNMNNSLRLSARLAVFGFCTLLLASSGQANETVVEIPAPTTSVELPNGVTYSQLSREDVEYAKTAARQAYHRAKAEGVQGPIVVQLPSGVFQLTEPVRLGPMDSGDAQRPIVILSPMSYS